MKQECVIGFLQHSIMNINLPLHLLHFFFYLLHFQLQQVTMSVEWLVKMSARCLVCLPQSSFRNTLRLIVLLVFSCSRSSSRSSSKSSSRRSRTWKRSRTSRNGNRIEDLHWGFRFGLGIEIWDQDVPEQKKRLNQTKGPGYDKGY